jgi:hypothetical protein
MDLNISNTLFFLCQSIKFVGHRLRRGNILYFAER